MFGKKFFDRLELQRICDHMLFFGEGNIEHGTLEERERSWEKAFYEGMRELCRQVRSYDWNAVGEREAEFKEEELSAPACEAVGKLYEVYFEAGVVAGFRLCLQILREKS